MIIGSTTIIGGIITSDQVRYSNSGYAPGDPLSLRSSQICQPGNYTAIVRGVNNTTGVALVEVYDLSPELVQFWATSVLAALCRRVIM